MLKVAVITPYYQESHEILRRCRHSILSQTYKNIHQIFVADGSPNSLIDAFDGSSHMILPKCHNDAGATPRAIGAISAFSQGYDAVAFLDADNTYNVDHIYEMIQSMQRHAVDVVTATRTICSTLGEPLYVDDLESTGKDFCDTNCMFLGKSTLNLLTYWITDADNVLISDRKFWDAVNHSKLSKFHCKTPTVNYYSNWACHYQNVGKIPPMNSVWMGQTPSGKLVHIRHSEIKKDKHES